MAQKDTVSIVIPVFNVELYLDDCLRSIVDQTYDKLEVILVDDGSTDASGVICDKWAKKDERFIVIHQENLGLSAARNVGLDHATGEYVLFVDPDDTVASNYELCRNAPQRHHQHERAMHNMRVFRNRRIQY